MIENEKLSESTAEDTAADYIAAINDLKANTVSKEDYLKLKQENKQLLNSLVNGETVAQEVAIERPTTEQLRLNLINAKTNLDYAKASLALRERNLEETGIDDYLPNAKTYSVTDVDRGSANRVATILQECIDGADNNPAVFRALFDSKVEDITIPVKR